MSNNAGRENVISADGRRVEGNATVADGARGNFVVAERNRIRADTAIANGQDGVWIDNTATQNVVMANVSRENGNAAEYSYRRETMKASRFKTLGWREE